jgi:class 3 adenylate cyclase
MSAIAFYKIISETRKAKKLRKYRENERLLNRMPGYEVKMGNGLHIGWAIEGAIGSYYKIDASYLSPNVKMAEKLEGATKTYGVPVLISSDIREHFSPEAA